MLEVQIENILPVTEARDKLNQLIDGVESSDNMYVMTKNGKPAAILVGVHHLEKLTGQKHEDLFGNNNKSKDTEESMSNDPMNQTPPVDDADASAGSASSTSQAVPPATDDTVVPATGGMPAVTDTQSAMAGDVIPEAEEKVEEAPPASPFAPAEPTVMSPAEPADTDVVPAAPTPTVGNATVGEEEKPADGQPAPTPPTPGV